MKAKTPTQWIDQRIVFTLHRDGLMDILGGAVVLTFGLVPILDETGMHPGIRQLIILLAFGLEAGIFLLLKRGVVRHRAGMVKLRRQKARGILIPLLVLNVLLLIFFLLVRLTDLPLLAFAADYRLSISLGMVFLFMFTMTGMALQAYRFLAYGVMIITAFVTMEHLYLKDLVNHHGIPMATLISGTMVALCGAWIFIRFLRLYKPENQ